MKLREELLPPKFDENKVAQLAELAERLDGCSTHLEDCVALLSQFNFLAGSNLKAEDFHFSGATDAGTFVRRVLTPTPQKVDDITYDEKLELITRICNADGTEYEISYWLEFLEIQLENSKLSDLIYYPEHYFGDGINRAEMRPREILDEAITNKPRVILLPPSSVT